MTFDDLTYGIARLQYNIINIQLLLLFKKFLCISFIGYRNVPVVLVLSSPVEIHTS